jgi:hypothetical protein
MSTVIRLNPLKQLRFQKLVTEVLGAKKPGDIVTYEECQKLLEGDDPRTYSNKIRRWFQVNGGRELVAIANLGWRVCTGSEQLRVALDHNRRATRQSRQALRSAMTANRDEMDDAEKQVADRFVQRTAANVVLQEETQRDSRKLLGAPRKPNPVWRKSADEK